MRTLFLTLLLPLTLLAGDFSPDPLSVRRHGPAYRYPQAGWIVLHIEGKPYERGVQHGTLMATEIAAYARCFAAQQSAKDPTGAWAHTRRVTKALFLRKFDKEYLEEMQGIADGAAEAGAKMDGKPIDLTDIVALNCWAELDCLDAGLDALPAGLEGSRLPGPKPKQPPATKAEHCSAFAATGPATADGKIVFGHITMFALYPSRFYNVWLDVQPEKGERVLMQSYPGGIQSGMDYYLTSAGLIVCETTIEQTRVNVDGIPLTNRIRKAVQYGKSIDDVVKVLSEGNNGLYSNEWLIADTKTNEIAMFELGTKTTKLWRSSKNEWFGNTPGFYWGCNNTKDLDVRLETFADIATGRPHATAWSPSARDKKWLQFYEAQRGKITVESGKTAFSTPPICARHSLDAKVTSSALVKELKTLAVFGPPIAGTWQPSDGERAEFPEIVPLVPNDWTVLRPHAPSRSETVKVVDLPTKAQTHLSVSERTPGGLPTTKAAWHGTLLPKADTDLWLTQGFAAYERIVAFENKLREERQDDQLTADDKERLAIELNLQRANLTLSAAAPKSIDEDAGERRARFVASETARGVVILHRLREAVGAKAFAEGIDEFGLQHGGKIVAANEFADFAKARWDQGAAEFKKWVDEETPASPWIRAWMDDLEHTTIVYGTTADSAANRETAKLLQKAVVTQGSNITLPMLSDSDALSSLDKLSTRHVLLIGGPHDNSLCSKWSGSLPVKFGSGSFEVRKEMYAHPGSAVIAAGWNPLSAKGPSEHRRATAVTIAGLSAEATRFALPFLLERSIRVGNVLVVPNNSAAKSVLVK